MKRNTTISPPTPPLEFKHAGRDITFTRLATRDVGGNVGDFIEIVNSSNADITIIGVTLDTHPHIFLNPFSPRTLKSGSSTVVNFDFNALGATDGDTYSTILRIVHSALPAGISDEPINISFKYTKPSFPIYEFADTSNITANILDNDPINFFFPGEVRGFAIKNTGQADLNISSISISGTDFTLANAGGTLSIKPGDFHIFRITMNVTSASGTLSIVEGSSITHTYNLQNPL
ncbi:MAG: hypothetical protein MUF42_04685 [Cytophagaceae bacterium]|nr:hypothetical protein [Cytophagaceae bacterium]